MNTLPRILATICETKRQEAAALLAAAFAGNPRVAATLAWDFGVLLELEPVILSFYGDNLGDRRGLSHWPAALAFHELVDTDSLGVPLYVSYAAR